MFEVSCQLTFAAAHALRGYKGKCERTHGHNYRVEVTAEGERLNEIGLLFDFVELKEAMRAVIDRIDHTFLNENPPFDTVNPSAENIARFFYEELRKPLEGRAHVSQVRVWETDNSVASYRPK